MTTSRGDGEPEMSTDGKSVTETPCPRCGERALRIETRYEARPIGSFSLAGAQMKFSAATVPWLLCDCGLEIQGKPAAGVGGADQ